MEQVSSPPWGEAFEADADAEDGNAEPGGLFAQVQCCSRVGTTISDEDEVGLLERARMGTISRPRAMATAISVPPALRGGDALEAAGELGNTAQAGVALEPSSERSYRRVFGIAEIGGSGAGCVAGSKLHLRQALGGFTQGLHGGTCPCACDGEGSAKKILA
jgi:hypothetical protein